MAMKSFFGQQDRRMPENYRKKRNPDSFRGTLPDEIDVLTDLERALKDVDVTVLAVASPYIRSTAHKMASFVCRDQKIVNVAKGIEEKTLKTLSEVIEEEIPQGNVAVLSGPSHAEEVGRGLPTTCVISAHTQETAEYLQSIFMSLCSACIQHRISLGWNLAEH